MNKLTEEQLGVIEARSKEFLCVIAYAGCGKTSTLIEYARARPNRKILYLAFNKSMADEAALKFREQRHVTSKTVHSLAYKHVGHRYREHIGVLRPWDLQNYATRLSRDSDSHLALGAILLRALNGYMSSSCETPKDFVYRTERSLESELDEYRVSLDAFQKVLTLLWDAITEKKLPVPHNAYLKLFQLQTPDMGYDIILIDEAQDITDAMIDISLSQHHSDKVYIGDPYQQIYAWNGAVNALEKVAEFGAQTLYLTQSFRCPQSVASEANQYLKLLGAEKPFTGTESDKESRKCGGKPAFIARTNASIFAQAYLNTTKRKKHHFLGGYEGYNFDTIVDIDLLCQGRKPFDSFLQRLGNERALSQYIEDANDQALRARLEIVKKYRGRTKGICDRIKRAETVISDAHMVMSTVHKAKGQEYDSVTLGEDFLDIQRSIENAGDSSKPAMILREELNLIYVAMTRTRKTLKCPKAIRISDDFLKKLLSLKERGRLIVY